MGGENKARLIAFLFLIVVSIFVSVMISAQTSTSPSDPTFDDWYKKMEGYLKDAPLGSSIEDFNTEFTKTTLWRKQLIDKYSEKDPYTFSKVWTTLNEENRKVMVTLIDAQQKLHLWKGFSSGYDSKKNNENKQIFLRKLDATQQKVLFESILEDKGFKGVTINGLVLSKNNQIDYSNIGGAERVIVKTDKGNVVIPLDKLPKDLTKMEIKDYAGISTVYAYSKNQKNYALFQDEQYVQAHKDGGGDNEWDVMKGETYQTTFHFGASTDTVFLAGKSQSLLKSGFHIWSAGHLGDDDNGAEIRQYDKGTLVYRVFPNPVAGRDTSSKLHYAFVNDLKNGAYNIYGNYKVEGFGAVVYNGFDGIIDRTGSYTTQGGQPVLKAIKDSAGKWTIDGTNVVSHVGRNDINHFVFNVKNDQFIPNKGAVYQYTHTAQGYVPRFGTDATQTTPQGGERVSNNRGATPTNNNAQRTTNDVLRKIGDERSRQPPSTTPTSGSTTSTATTPSTVILPPTPVSTVTIDKRTSRVCPDGNCGSRLGGRLAGRQ